MLDELEGDLGKKIEQENAKLKKVFEKELEDRVGKRLDAMDKRLDAILKEIKSMDNNMGEDIKDAVKKAIKAEFDKLYKKKVIGRFEDK